MSKNTPKAAPAVEPQVDTPETPETPAGTQVETAGFQIVDNTAAEKAAPVAAESVERELSNGMTVVDYR